MPWYLNPRRIRGAVRDVRSIAAGGGPRSVRLDGVGRPAGWILPTSTIGLQLVARDGTAASFQPELPVPLPLAYGYRLARALGVPFVSEIEPERIDVTVSLPAQS